MRVRLSELRAIIRRVITEVGESPLELRIISYRDRTGIVPVLTNNVSILFRKDNTLGKDPTQPEPYKVMQLGPLATAEDLAGFDKTGVDKLKKPDSYSIKYPNNAGRAA